MITQEKNSPGSSFADQISTAAEWLICFFVLSAMLVCGFVIGGVFEASRSTLTSEVVKHTKAKRLQPGSNVLVWPDETRSDDRDQ